jgi:hypothetical protein
MAFDDNVFINCPFDREYYGLLRPILFTVIYLGLQPRIALERSDSGEARIEKILELIQESKRYRYQAALSDLSGSDIAVHGNEPEEAVVVVRNWLAPQYRPNAAGPARIWGAFTDFMAANYDALKLRGFSDKNIEDLPISELLAGMENWIAGNV